VGCPADVAELLLPRRSFRLSRRLSRSPSTWGGLSRSAQGAVRRQLPLDLTQFQWEVGGNRQGGPGPA
jgi:hypothetical protein